MDSAVMSGKARLAIVNRTMWPAKSVVAEALVCTAERLSSNFDVELIGQSNVGVREALQQAGRGDRLRVSPIKLHAKAHSGIFLRMIDAIRFGVWVLFRLLLSRPQLVYIATDPPVVVPFLASVYAKLTGAMIVYHVQDIHPESANLIKPLNPLFLRLLVMLDNRTLRAANLVITLTSQMKHYLVQQRRVDHNKVVLMVNAGADADNHTGARKPIFGFCGNAGRFQRIPLLLDGIRAYLSNAGNGQFVFVGGGLYSNDIQALAKDFPENVEVKGVVSPSESARLMASWEWGLLPIDDDVLNYAFPSKTSSYLNAGCHVIAICSQGTAIAEWIEQNGCGVVVPPKVAAIADCLEAHHAGGLRDSTNIGLDRRLCSRSVEAFAEELSTQLSSLVSETVGQC